MQFSLESLTDWEVLQAASGREGLAIATAEQPDAILLDLMMPMIDGIETFHQLQADAKTCSIPVILLTAKSSIAQPPWLGLAFAGLITKPFEPEELVEQTCKVLQWLPQD